MTENKRRKPRCGDVWVNPFNNTEVLAGEGPAVLRHYIWDTVENAIRKWGLIRDEQSILLAADTVWRLAELRGTSVFEIFYLDDRGYLTFVFEDDINRGSAFVNVGHVDHYTETDWSVQVEKKPGLWRTYLPSSRNVGVHGHRVTETTCDCNVGVIISIYAPCDRCGLRSIDRVEEYAD